MSKLSQSILDTIQKKKIIPRSRWYFIGLHTLLWGCFSVTLIVGIMGVSLLFLEMNMPERHYMQWMPLSGPMNLLPYLPFLWGGGSLLCVIIAYYVFYKTERGYRISTLWIVSLLIFGSFAGGYILHRTKMNSLGERQIQRFIPPYQRMKEDFRRGIPLPESGILPGKIQTIDDTTYTVRCPDKTVWTVLLNCSTESCREKQNNLPTNTPLLFIGAIQGNKAAKIFEATDVEFSPRNKKGKMKNLLLPPPLPEGR